jgi:hypothetical protein
MKGTGELRQGDLLNTDTVNLLCSVAVQKPFRQPAADSLCIVLTQDCDIVHNNVAEEPFIECILCHSIRTVDGNKLNGKNPRVLHIHNDTQNFEIYIHDRFLIEKEKLAEQKLVKCTAALSADTVKILKKWIARRYTRSAFPDAFNNRLKQSKKFQKIAAKEISEHVSHVFFEVEDRELPGTENYRLNVIIVVDAEENTNRTTIEAAYDEALNVEGIDTNIFIHTEEEVTLADLRTYKRWDQKDSYSLSGHAAPIDEIDTI